MTSGLEYLQRVLIDGRDLKIIDAEGQEAARVVDRHKTSAYFELIAQLRCNVNHDRKLNRFYPTRQPLHFIRRRVVRIEEQLEPWLKPYGLSLTITIGESMLRVKLYRNRVIKANWNAALT